jgi:hypothetical protein
VEVSFFSSARGIWTSYFFFELSSSFFFTFFTRSLSLSLNKPHRFETANLEFAPSCSLFLPHETKETRVSFLE